MAWYDDLLDWGSKAYEAAKPVAETAWNFAKENPTASGAALGLLTGGGTGNYGSSNLGNTLGGAALGYTAGQMFGGAAPQVQQSAQAPGMTGQTGGWQPTSAGNPNAFSSAVSNAVPAAATSSAFGAGVGDTVTSGMNDIAAFGKKYQAPLKVGMQLASTLEKRGRVADTEAMLKGQAGQEASRNAELGRLDTADRQIIDDSNAAERAYSAMAPKNAYSNVINATGRAVRAAGMDPNQTATQSAARKRALSLAGTAGATTAAAGASRQPSLKGYGTPRQTSNSAATAAAGGGARADNSMWQDYAALGQSALGWDDTARKPVNP